MPVDETRYLTVAWEMMTRGDWVLPTLNYNPYSHKPPLIFWLIHASWEIFGVHVAVARAVIFAAVAALLMLIARLTRLIYPEQPHAPIIAVLLMCAMPAYLTYGGMIMFDSLLALFVLGAMIIIWRAGQADDRKNWILLGFVTGFGILAKGPVALVYILPVALLAPFWIHDRIVNWRKWFLGVLVAVMLAITIGLAWSMPAAVEGGVWYAERLFFAQSAGRMVDAFDHKEPFWFYIPALIIFVFPFLVWPSLWKATRSYFIADQKSRFLICWVIPAFLFFSFISSKSIHYVIPFLPGLAILIAGILSRHKIENPESVRIPIIAMMIPSAIALVAHFTGMTVGGFSFSDNGILLAVTHLLASVVLYWWAGKHTDRPLHALVIGSALLVVMMHAQLGPEFLKRYDLSAAAHELHKYENRPWAAAPKYDGEYGFVARTDRQFFPLGRENIDWWFEHNPDGIIIGRYSEHTLPNPDFYTTLYQQPFRKKEFIVIFEKKKGSTRGWEKDWGSYRKFFYDYTIYGPHLGGKIYK